MVSVQTWLIVDAVLDNFIAVEVQSLGDEKAVAHAQALRQRGWGAARVHPLNGQGPAGWPPIDAVLPIDLGQSDVTFVREQLDDAAVVTRQLLGDERFQGLAREEQEESLQGIAQARAELG